MPVVCQLDAIVDGEARGFDIETAGGVVGVICVRQGSQVLAYRNRCPHTGINLEWQPDQFLDETKNYLVCSTHGALFQVGDGYCVAGPCSGDSLEALPARVEQGEVVVDVSGNEE